MLRIVFLILFFLRLHLLSAQTGKEKVEWFSLGYGHGYKYFRNDMDGNNFGGSYNFNNYKRFYKRLAFDITYNPSHTPASVFVRRLYTVNYAYGKLFRNDYFILSISTGPTINWGRQNNNTSFIHVGLSANICFAVKLLPDLAIGIEGFSNANFIQSTHGFRVVLIGMSKK